MFGKRETVNLAPKPRQLLGCGHDINSLVRDPQGGLCGSCGWELLPLSKGQVIVEMQDTETKRQKLLFCHKSEMSSDPETNELILAAPRDYIPWDANSVSHSGISGWLIGGVDLMESFYGRQVSHAAHTDSSGRIFFNVSKHIAHDRFVYIQSVATMRRKLAEVWPGRIRLTPEISHSLAARGFYGAKVTYEREYDLSGKEKSWLETLKQEGRSTQDTLCPEVEFVLEPYVV